MKWEILLAGLLLTASLSGCSLWEDRWNECTPLPGTEVDVPTDPWEPPVDGGGELGVYH